MTNAQNIPNHSKFEAVTGVSRDLLHSKYKYLIDLLIPILLDSTDLRSYTTLARDLIAEEYLMNHHIAKKIMQMAAYLAAQKYNSNLPQGAELIDLDDRTSRVRSSSNLLRDSAKTMLDAMGRRMFSDDEILTIVRLMHSHEFVWRDGCNAGKPNWSKIADELNTQFRTSRTGQSLSSQIKVMRYNQDPRLAEAYLVLQQEA